MFSGPPSTGRPRNLGVVDRGLGLGVYVCKRRELLGAHPLSASPLTRSKAAMAARASGGGRFNISYILTSF